LQKLQLYLAFFFSSSLKIIIKKEEIAEKEKLKPNFKSFKHNADFTQFNNVFTAKHTRPG
jgi:hypothetical protein